MVLTLAGWVGKRKLSRPIIAGGRRGGAATRYQKPDYKIAFVTLVRAPLSRVCKGRASDCVTLQAEGEEFEYPDLFPEEKAEESTEST